MNKKNFKCRIEITSLAFKNKDWKDKFDAIRQHCEFRNFDFGIQLHNSDTEEQLAKFAELGVSLSFHAPILSDWQINLAALDASKSFESIHKTAEMMRKYHVKNAVFHAFNMTDKDIPSFGRGRDYVSSFNSILREELCLEKGSAICSDFFNSEEYIVRKSRVSERLARIRMEYPDLIFLIENDFPCYGAGSIFAEHLVPMNNPICLDTSHLWASSFIFDRNYHSEVEAFLSSGLVRMVHLHASKYTSQTPKAKWSDGHLPLNTPNDMNLPKLIHNCKKYSVLYFVLEINDISISDINFIFESLNTSW